ncbi:hypothetical protein LOZ20_006865, partial [Ophidiomyces ophidiicola]
TELNQSLTLIAIQDWHICLPTEQLEQATDLFRERPECYIPFRRSALSYSERIDFAYPRFKLAGLSLFFILMPSEACHLDVTPANIDFSAMGLPYPTLPVFAQSLLDGNPGVDLEDLIDGMDLTLDWGEQHLDLGGTVDADWIWWRFSIAYDFNYEDERPPWYSSPDKRRDVWAKQTSPEAKKTRQSWKYRPNYATRFRKIGSKDPRSLYRNYCELVMLLEVPKDVRTEEFYLGDFGIAMEVGDSTVQHGYPTLEFCSPDRLHGECPSFACDMWSYMVIFSKLYLGYSPISSWLDGGAVSSMVRCLGPLPEKWRGHYVHSKKLDSWYDQSKTPDSKRTLAAKIAHFRPDADPAEQRDVLSILTRGLSYCPEKQLTATELLQDPSFLAIMATYNC